MTTSHSGLTVLSKKQSFITLHASGLDGPKTRQRLVCRDESVPEWLSTYAPYFRLGRVIIAVAMGRTRLGSVTRIRSIVSFTPLHGQEPFACVYVEEQAGGESSTRTAAPVHIVGCPQLPKIVRFVEVIAGQVSPGPPLRIA